jgi:hypothetical protein
MDQVLRWGADSERKWQQIEAGCPRVKRTRRHIGKIIINHFEIGYPGCVRDREWLK